MRCNRFHGFALVEAGRACPGDHQWMRGLHQHRSRASEQHRDLAMHLPADALRPEVAEIAVRGHARHCIGRRREGSGRRRLDFRRSRAQESAPRIRSSSYDHRRARPRARGARRDHRRWLGSLPRAHPRALVGACTDRAGAPIVPASGRERRARRVGGRITRRQLRAIARRGGGEPTGPRCGTDGDGPHDEPGRGRVERRDAGEPRCDAGGRSGRSDRHRGRGQASPDDGSGCAAAAGRRDPGRTAVRRGALVRRRAAVRGDGVVVFRRHAWTVPREPSGRRLADP